MIVAIVILYLLVVPSLFYLLWFLPAVEREVLAEKIKADKRVRRYILSKLRKDIERDRKENFESFDEFLTFFVSGLQHGKERGLFIAFMVKPVKGRLVKYSYDLDKDYENWRYGLESCNTALHDKGTYII